MEASSIQWAQVAIPAVVAVAVVGIAHIFTTRRDVANNRREQRIGYLVAAFRALAKANNHPRLHEVASDVEQAVADIQLFGTSKQIDLVQRFATDLGTKQSADMDALLLELRNSLRAELGAESVPGRVVWLRIGGKERM